MNRRGTSHPKLWKWLAAGFAFASCVALLNWTLCLDLGGLGKDILSTRFVLTVLSSLLWCVALVLALAVSAIAVLRRTVRQQKAVLRAVSETRTLKDAHEQVIANLPTGLFTYRSGKFKFTNWCWDAQIMREPGETPTDALLRAVHPDDVCRVASELRHYEEREEPFTINFRVRSEFDDVRHLECRGVPVYDEAGLFLHMLGFSLDVTEVVEAHDELSLKHSELDFKNRMLTKALADLEHNLEEMVRSLVKAIEAKDPYTAGHSERVMEYSLRIGELLDLSEEQLKALRMGTLIHDIGKIGVPDEVLTKPSSLTAQEYEIIKLHPETGYNMIRDIPLFAPCAPIVRWHHERLNGSGYPDRLRGDQLDILVRISAVADIFDAMTSTRAYRRGMNETSALAELRREATNGAIDSEVVEALAELLRRDMLQQREAA